MSARDKKGLTPLHSFVIQSTHSSDSLEHLEKMVLEFGADPKYGNRTALDLLCDQVHESSDVFLGPTDFVTSVEPNIGFLISQEQVLSPATARRVWNLYEKVLEAMSDETEDAEEMLPDVWPLRMYWMECHSRVVYGIAPEETRTYPVHELMRCCSTLLLPATSSTARLDDVIDWKEILVDHFGTEACMVEDTRGFVPLQLYLHQRQEDTRREEQSDAVILDLGVLRELLGMDTRPSSLARRRRVSFGGGTTVINPFTTSIEATTQPQRENKKANEAAACVLLDLLYRLVRAQPETLKRSKPLED